jgi:LuxR family transcriptional regulator, maltose regulon positive regulatory protein
MIANILLVDDHPVFRRGLHSLLEEEEDLVVVGEAGNGLEALEQVRVLKPDVVIMDISMPHLDGIEATRRIISEAPELKIIALSIHGGKRFVENMLRAGVAGYILKDSVPEELVKGIRAVLRGEMYLSSEVIGLVVSQYVDVLSRAQASGGPELLTEKEREFIELTGEGLAGGEIAHKLNASEASMKSIQEGVLRKLNLSSVSELVEYAGAQKWFSGHVDIEVALQQAVTSGRPISLPPKPPPLIEALTNRELDILELLVKRLYNKEIADELSVSVETVKTHVKSIFRKLEVRNRREAVVKAKELGLIRDEI